jgi:CheY-like chemotaxis protein
MTMSISKSIIFVVEDNCNVLDSLKLFLEMNDFRVFTALNGEDAFNKLHTIKEVPDLILCDIMMPIMNGYEFYKKVAQHPVFAMIPFIFLSAKSEPDDIRLGKLLGVDDYITKPFNEEDLLASIRGKISRNKRNIVISKQFEEKVDATSISLNKFVTQWTKQQNYLLYVVWDDIFGPHLVLNYPENPPDSLNMQKIGEQLFSSASALYGYDKINEPQGISLKISNIGLDCYIYFDRLDDKQARGGVRIFMLGFITSVISYLQSLRIRNLFEEIAQKIQKNVLWQPKTYWEKIIEMMS